MTKSYMDLVEECDNFPYYQETVEDKAKLKSKYFALCLTNGNSLTEPYGYLPTWVVDKMPWEDRWDIDHERKIVTPKTSADNWASQNQIIRDTLLQARQLKIFKVLAGWRSELYPVHGKRTEGEEPIVMERAGTALFGINTYGVHLTVYTHTTEGMRIWVPRRARSKQTYGGMLDNTVAGGLAAGEEPFECLVREADEEASLSEQLVRSNAKACGIVSYVHVRDERAGGETGLLQPECQYVYDMEVGPGVQPRPNDEEVEEFYLWTVDEVKQGLATGQFKPNCALVLLDFFTPPKTSISHDIVVLNATADSKPQRHDHNSLTPSPEPSIASIRSVNACFFNPYFFKQRYT
ncbi:uncharacterized protein KY384_007732 [Bacidia gigantensis]|uniref:uncharacterized protein n=1 Tax=Bacidia gigantensis TaxID=2732470 RepID=UPI001D047716|nr:uncharacterized protein KY384_007732 [Bacidia gigantensis]KAG8527579.1 hypothetical protein KY384_007732 [Bacidia gigantensis]